MNIVEQLVALDADDSTCDMRIHSFNPDLNTWSIEKLPAIWDDRRYFGLVLINRTIIFAGGNINSNATNEVLCLNLQTMKYYKNAPMKQARSSCKLVELKDDVYVVGGRVNGKWSSSVEKYNFSIGKWHDVAPLRSPMSFVSVAVLNGLLYAIDEYSSMMECYDPSSNKWLQKSAPNSKLQSVGLIGFGGSLYTVGGYKNGTCCATVEHYDPSTDTWETKQSMNVPRYGVHCTVLPNRLLACGGMESDHRVSTIVEEYNPQTEEWNIVTHLLIHKRICSGFK